MIESRSPVRRITHLLIVLLLLLIAAVCVAPILNTVALSFSDAAKAQAGVVGLLPVGFTTNAYAKILQDKTFTNSFWISIKRVAVGGSLNMALIVMLAYPLSKNKEQFRLRQVYIWLLAFAMLFSGGIIPWYLTIRRLGLLNSFWALVLPCAVPVYNVILMMNFFRGVPKALEEAAIIDGASQPRVLAQVYLPVSLPALATIGLFTVVNHWNSFMDGMLLMNTPNKYPLQTYIQQFVVVINTNNIVSAEQLLEMQKISGRTLNGAKIVVAMVPILALYPILQRYFVTGLVMGSVKG